jgi:hypothetical protein
MSGHVGVAMSGGGMRRFSGKKSHDAPLSKAELKEFNSHCNCALGHQPRREKSIRHFSHFDSAISSLSTLSPEEALQKSVALLGEMSTVGFRGVRPQLARLLVVLAQLARRDGYSLRVVAETALHL